MRSPSSALALAALALTACDGGLRCDYTGGVGRMVWSGCADGVSREITCDEVTCHCRENGASARTFKRARWPWANRTEATDMANEACGWRLSKTPF
jgi:hypothetical protein